MQNSRTGLSSIRSPDSSHYSKPTFLQIYFMKGIAADQVERRSRITDVLRTEILLDLQDTSQTSHLNIRELKAAYEFAETNS